MKNAIILTSGGMDSVILAHYVKKVKKVKDLKLIFLNYGQKALEEELLCVKRLSKEINSKLKVIDLPWLGKISTSLINKKTTKKTLEKIKPEEEISSWYVPCRNSLFLLIGLAIAESDFISKKEKADIYLGIKYEGNLQFKDTTPEFLEQMNNLSKFCTQEGNLKFIAPFLDKDKEELIELSQKLKIDLKDTFSCYIGSDFKKVRDKKIPVHCGICGSCKARKKAFKFSHVEDPSIYKI